MVVYYTIFSVILVSLVSLIGVFSFFTKKAVSNEYLLLLVSLSIGTLFGGALLHLLPEAVGISGFTTTVSLSALAGIIVFFIIESFIHSHHTKIPKDHTHYHHRANHLGFMNLAGDSIHNFIDGLIIAGSYLVSIPTGIAATLAVIMHEVPQEIADFGILLYSGMSKKKALLANFLSGAVAILGAIIGLLLGTRSEYFLSFLLPFAAGGFLYIAGANLIPELHKCCSGMESIKYFFAIVLGIGMMYGLLFIT